MNIARQPFGPVGSRIYWPDFTVHGDFELLVIPSSSLKLVANTGDAVCPRARGAARDGLRHVEVVVFDDLSLLLVALREGAKLLGAVKAEHFGDFPS
jgi:hypothetical protein